MTPVFTDSALDHAWPFWVLQLSINATSAEIEKAARDIGAKLQLGVKGADSFSSPVGDHPRDEFLVREAKAKLHNPESRLLAEFWYVNPEQKAKDSESSFLISSSRWQQILGDTLWEA